MIRWVAWFGVAVASAVALAGTYGYDGDEVRIVDELIVYQITPDESVTVEVPAGISKVLLTAWCVLDPEQVGQWEDRYEYAVSVELSDPQRAPRGTRRYGAVSRLTSYPGHPTAGGFTARLVDSDQPVTDPRTLEIDTRAISETGGTMRVVAARARYRNLVVRMSYRHARTELERRVVARSMRAEDYARLLGGTTALGFVDLSPRARARALSTWARRLTAEGRQGEDYRVRRLLVGELGQRPARMKPRQPGFAVGPWRAAVVNLRGETQLRLQGVPGAELRVVEGQKAERVVTIGGAGYEDVTLSEPAVRSVFVRSDEPTEIRLSVPKEYVNAQVGDVDRAIRADGRVRVAPDVRTHRYHRLDPSEPLRYGVMPRQGPFRVQLRAIVDPVAPRQQTDERLVVEWSDARGQVHVAARPVRLAHSEFESFGESGHATDSTVVYLTLPDGAEHVGLRGPRSLAVRVAVDEPGVDQGRMKSPYVDARLAPGQRWRYAPYETTRRATVRPTTEGDPVGHSRMVKLRAQVRLTYPGQAPVAERAVQPLGDPLRRQLLVRRPLSSMDAADDPLFELAGPARVRVPPRGPRARRIGIRFHADPSQLGQTLRVRVDGEERFAQPLLLTSGRFELPVEAGMHRLAITGLGEEGVAYVDARPSNATHFVKRYHLAELTGGRPLVFAVRSAADRARSLLLFVATEGSGRPVRLVYDIDRGRPNLRSDVLFRHVTQATGELTVTSGGFERGALLQAERAAPPRVSAGPDGISRVRIRLGDDLQPTKHRIRVRMARTGDGPRRVWVRAVLVGEKAPADDEQHRLWTREAEP